MSKTQSEVRSAVSLDVVNSPMFDRIGFQVLQALGEPTSLRGVNVRQLWEHHYRANVLVGPDSVSVTVAHSYFLVADAAGTIVTSTPPITRHY